MNFNHEAVRVTAKSFWKKIRMPFFVLIILVLIGSGGSAWFHYQTHINGIVTATNGSNVTISNPLFSRTVDLSTATMKIPTIHNGDKIHIVRNISGTILAVQTGKPWQHDRIGKHEGFRNGAPGNQPGPRPDCPYKDANPPKPPVQPNQPAPAQSAPPQPSTGN